MEIIYFLVPIGIVMLVIAIGLFSWAVRSDQFDDLDREGQRILFDEDRLVEDRVVEDRVVEDRVNTAKKPQAPPTTDPAPPMTTDVTTTDATTTTPTERPQDGTKP